MTGLDIAALLKEHGGWGLSALLILALAFLIKVRDADAKAATSRHDAAVERYTKQLETLVSQTAVTIERSSATNAAVSAALESRTGIFERLSEAVEEARRESRTLMGELKSHAVSNDQWTREKLDEAAKRIEDILDRVKDLRREAPK